MKLFIPADKVNHYFVGTVVALIVVVVCGLLDFKTAAPFLAAIAATIIGVLGEVVQYLDNRAKERRGLPVQHSVESMDAVYTAGGGLIIGMAVYFNQILP